MAVSCAAADHTRTGGDRDTTLKIGGIRCSHRRCGRSQRAKPRRPVAAIRHADGRPSSSGSGISRTAHRRRYLAAKLWVLRGSADTLLSAPVAVGSGQTLRSGARTWSFATPRGIRIVVSKDMDPVWVRPDWDYVEVARANHLRLDSVSARRSRPQPDGSQLVVRDGVVGVERDSTFTPWPVDDEIVLDRVLYAPPIGTEYRAVHGVLGHYRLGLGGAIGLHGTNDHASIGHAVTHGCLRLTDADLEWLFSHIPIGTRVFIY